MADQTAVDLTYSLKPAADVQSRLQRQMADLERNLRFRSPFDGSATRSVRDFGSELDRANQRVITLGASFAVLSTSLRTLRNIAGATVEVEKAFTEINAVFQLGSAGLDKFSKDLFSAARNTGQSFERAATAAKEFSRQGLTAEETIRRTTDALVLTRLANIDVSKSVETLTASLNGFSKSALTSAEIVNKLATVDSKFAVSSSDLAEALSRSGAAASDAGVSFDELIGLVTAAQQTTARGGAVIGNALKTIFTRIERRDTLEAMESLGVSVRDASGEFLTALPLLQNFASAYDGLEGTLKKQAAAMVGGVFQINILKAVLGDLAKANGIAAQATDISANATNEAILRNEALNKSLDSMLNKLGATAKQIGSNIGSQSFAGPLKGILGVVGDNPIVAALEDASGKAETIGGKTAEFFLQGFGGSLVFGLGPLVGKALGKIIFNTSKNLFRDFQDLSGLKTQGQQQVAIQSEVVNLYRAGGTALRQQLAAMTSLTEKTALLQRILTATTPNSTAQMAAALYQAGYRGRGQPVAPKAAGGYIPPASRIPTAADGRLEAELEEAQAIAAGVGGAPASARPKLIPDFDFGGGRRGPLVANTSEYLLPMASGGTAVLNQEMVRDMGGLPPGAMPVAAAGLIPRAAGGTPLQPKQAIGSKVPFRFGDRDYGLDLKVAEAVGDTARVPIGKLLGTAARGAVPEVPTAAGGITPTMVGGFVKRFTVGKTPLEMMVSPPLSGAVSLDFGLEKGDARALAKTGEGAVKTLKVVREGFREIRPLIKERYGNAVREVTFTGSDTQRNRVYHGLMKRAGIPFRFEGGDFYVGIDNFARGYVPKGQPRTAARGRIPTAAFGSLTGSGAFNTPFDYPQNILRNPQIVPASGSTAPTGQGFGQFTQPASALPISPDTIKQLEKLFTSLRSAATVAQASQFGPQIVDLAKSLGGLSEKQVLKRLGGEFNRIGQVEQREQQARALRAAGFAEAESAPVPAAPSERVLARDRAAAEREKAAQMEQGFRALEKERKLTAAKKGLTAEEIKAGEQAAAATQQMYTAARLRGATVPLNQSIGRFGSALPTGALQGPPLPPTSAANQAIAGLGSALPRTTVYGPPPLTTKQQNAIALANIGERIVAPVPVRVPFEPAPGGMGRNYDAYLASVEADHIARGEASIAGALGGVGSRTRRKQTTKNFPLTAAQQAEQDRAEFLATRDDERKTFAFTRAVGSLTAGTGVTNAQERLIKEQLAKQGQAAALQTYGPGASKKAIDLFVRQFVDGKLDEFNGLAAKALEERARAAAPQPGLFRRTGARLRGAFNSQNSGFALAFGLPFAGNVIDPGVGGTTSGVLRGAASSGLTAAGALASVGLGFGPQGALVGAGIGLVVGGAAGALRKMDKSFEDLAKEINETTSKIQRQVEFVQSAFKLQDDVVNAIQQAGANPTRRQTEKIDELRRARTQSILAIEDPAERARVIRGINDPNGLADSIERLTASQRQGQIGQAILGSTTRALDTGRLTRGLFGYDNEAPKDIAKALLPALRSLSADNVQAVREMSTRNPTVAFSRVLAANGVKRDDINELLSRTNPANPGAINTIGLLERALATAFKNLDDSGIIQLEERLQSADRSAAIFAESLEQLSSRYETQGRLIRVNADALARVQSVREQVELDDPRLTGDQRLRLQGRFEEQNIRLQAGEQRQAELSEGRSALIDVLRKSGARGADSEAFREMIKGLSSLSDLERLRARLDTDAGRKGLPGVGTEAFTETLEKLIQSITILDATEKAQISTSRDTNRILQNQLALARTFAGARRDYSGAAINAGIGLADTFRRNDTPDLLQGRIAESNRAALNDEFNRRNGVTVRSSPSLRSVFADEFTDPRLNQPSVLRGPGLTFGQFRFPAGNVASNTQGAPRMTADEFYGRELGLDANNAAVARVNAAKSVRFLQANPTALGARDLTGDQVTNGLFAGAKQEGIEGRSLKSLTGGFQSVFAGIKRDINDLSDLGAGLAESLSSNLSNAFGDFVTGAKRGKDAFRDFAASVTGEASRMLASKAITGLISAIPGFAGASGGKITASGFTPFARGGPVLHFANGGGVPAMVMGGEFFVGPQAARRIGYDRLRELNRYAEGGVVQHLAGGGMIRGGSGVRDDIPMRLPPGSFILRKSATQRLGADYLNALAAGRVQHRVDGGLIASIFGGAVVGGGVGYATGGKKGAIGGAVLGGIAGGVGYSAYKNSSGGGNSAMAGDTGMEAPSSAGALSNTQKGLIGLGAAGGLGLLAAGISDKGNKQAKGSISLAEVPALRKQLEADQQKYLGGRGGAQQVFLTLNPQGGYSLSGLGDEPATRRWAYEGGEMSSGMTMSPRMSTGGEAAQVSIKIEINNNGAVSSESNGKEPFGDGSAARLEKTVKGWVQEEIVRQSRPDGFFVQRSRYMNA